MGQETVSKARWLSTMDLLTMAAIAVVGAAFCSYVFPALMHVATPVFAFLGPVGWIAASGVYTIFPVLFSLLVAKPGATTIYGILQGLVEILFGNAFGAMAMVYSGLESLGVDLGQGIFRYRGSLVSAMVAGGLGSLFIDTVYLFIFGMANARTLLVGGITAFISGAVLGGLVGWLIARALARTGIVGRIGLKGYQELD
jgi:energy-coupling factor transport system substrate-specific component